MPQTYFAILTAVGEAKDANAKALGIPFVITHMALGDGAGVVPVPVASRTTLFNEVRRAPLNQLSRDPVNLNQLIAEQVIPENVGGWWIREIGLIDEDGDLIAIANCPPTYKPLLAEGSGRTQVVRMVLIMSGADAVTLKIDPAVVLATRKYADDAVTASMVAHLAAANPHPMYLKKSEFEGRAGNAGSVYFRNRAVNGDMSIDQRNQGAAYAIFAGVPQYVVDRIAVQAVTAGITAQQVAGTGSYEYELLLIGAAGNTSVDIRHKVESINTFDLKNSDVSVQVELSSNAVVNVNWFVYYPNAKDVFSANTLIASGVIAINAAATIKTFSFNGGPNIRNGLQISFILGALTAGQTFRMSGLQVEKGSTASEFERIPQDINLYRCRRYYEASEGASSYVGAGSASGPNTFQGTGGVFKVQKRTVPTITTFDSSGNSGRLTFSTPAITADYLATPDRVTKENFGAYTNTGSFTQGEGGFITGRWTASAEL